MTPDKLFELIKKSDYVTSGLKVDWLVTVDDEEKTVRLLFQESDGKMDWFVNFDFPVKPYKEQENVIWIHRGWAKAWKSCNDEIMSAVIRCIESNKDYSVQVSGWSYGGAMAVIAAEDLHFRTGINPDVVTFGAPNPLFGKKTKCHFIHALGKVTQYAHVNDIVPCVPPAPYCQVNKIHVGTGKSFWKLFNPRKYHTGYGDSYLYKENV